MVKPRSFSERMGYVPPPVLQVDSLDKKAQVAIVNAFARFGEFLDRSKGGYGGSSGFDTRGHFASALLADHFDVPRHLLGPFPSDIWTKLLETLLEAEWHELLGACERAPSCVNERIAGEARKWFDQVFVEQNIGYRFAGSVLLPLADPTQLDAIAAGRNVAAATVSDAAVHLEAAAMLLRNPGADYRNSIKESICAVEATFKHLTGDPKTTLSDGLKALQQSGNPLHPALHASWNSLYGWAGDGDGIRHALKGEANVSLELALYMLVNCSAFVSYLLTGDRAR
jgi:hypothetical protein